MILDAIVLYIDAWKLSPELFGFIDDFIIIIIVSFYLYYYFIL